MTDLVPCANQTKEHKCGNLAVKGHCMCKPCRINQAQRGYDRAQNKR